MLLFPGHSDQRLDLRWQMLTLRVWSYSLQTLSDVFIGMAWFRDGLAKDIDGSDFRAKDGAEGP